MRICMRACHALQVYQLLLYVMLRYMLAIFALNFASLTLPASFVVCPWGGFFEALIPLVLQRFSLPFSPHGKIQQTQCLYHQRKYTHSLLSRRLLDTRGMRVSAPGHLAPAARDHSAEHPKALQLNSSRLAVGIPVPELYSHHPCARHELKSGALSGSAASSPTLLPS